MKSIILKHDNAASKILNMLYNHKYTSDDIIIELIKYTDDISLLWEAQNTSRLILTDYDKSYNNFMEDEEWLYDTVHKSVDFHRKKYGTSVHDRRTNGYVYKLELDPSTNIYFIPFSYNYNEYFSLNYKKGVNDLYTKEEYYYINEFFYELWMVKNNKKIFIKHNYFIEENNLDILYKSININTSKGNISRNLLENFNVNNLDYLIRIYDVVKLDFQKTHNNIDLKNGQIIFDEKTKYDYLLDILVSVIKKVTLKNNLFYKMTKKEVNSMLEIYSNEYKVINLFQLFDNLLTYYDHEDYLVVTRTRFCSHTLGDNTMISGDLFLYLLSYNFKLCIVPITKETYSPDYEDDNMIIEVWLLEDNDKKHFLCSNNGDEVISKLVEELYMKIINYYRIHWKNKTKYQSFNDYI